MPGFPSVRVRRRVECRQARESNTGQRPNEFVLFRVMTVNIACLTTGQEISVEVDENQSFNMEVGTGEAALFAHHIAHASHPNRSEDRCIFSRFERLDALCLGLVHFALIYDAAR